MPNDEVNHILEKIKKLTYGYKGEEKPVNRLDWLQSLLSAYQKYLPARVIEKIKIDPTAERIEGERRYITVLFADLSGFTALSETMDAEDIAKIINDFFTRMVKIVHKYGGSVDKFLGDALMVLFGAPVAHYDDPERAVRAALEMQEEMARFNTEKKIASPLSMSIGINSGPAVALNVGSEERMEYTVIGDTVNLAARLESVSGPKEIIISHFTYERIADIVDAEKRPSVKVKGKKKPIVNYLVREIQEHYRLPEITKIKFVGRESELKIIKNSLNQVKSDILKIIGISGEPGSGKTRLGIETEVLARENNFVAFAIKCVPYEMNIPYNSFIEFFNNYFQFKKDVTEEEKRLLISVKLKNLDLSLDNTLPYVGILYGMDFAEIQSLPPDELKRRIFTTIKEILQKEAKKILLFIRIEDLQWADPTSIEVLDYLLKELKNFPIMFLFEYRSDYAFPWLGFENCENIFLKNLTEEEARDLIKSILGEEHFAQEIENLVFEKSLGNPLFTTEIVKLLIKKNGIRKTVEGFVPTERFTKLEIAESVSAVILDQVDRMSEFDKRILQYASVVGKTFEPILLSTILKVPLQFLSEELERLEHFEGMLVSDSATNTYEFISSTTYEVVYGSLLKSKRKQLHTAIGEELERIRAEKAFENLEKLAYHFARSNDEPKGVYYLKSAADKSYRLYALKETLNFFDRALELLHKKELSQEEIQDKIEVLRRQGLVLRLVGKLPEAIRNQKQSLTLARRVTSLKDEAGANLNIGKIYQEMGILKKALNYWKRARKIAKKIGDKNIETLAINNLGTYYLQIGNMNKAFNCFQNVSNLSEKINDKRGTAFANLNLGAVMEKKGEFAKAFEYYNKAHINFEETDDKENTLRSLHQMAIAQMWLGKFEECLKNFNTVAELSIKFGDRMMESIALGSIGEVYGRMWQLDKAYEKFSQSLAIAQILSEPQQITVSNINIGDVHLYQGGLNQALEYHNKAIEMATQIQDPFNEALAWRSLGWDYYYSADYKKAKEKFENSESIFKNIGDRRNGVISKLASIVVEIKFANIEETEQLLKNIEAKAREINDFEILALVLDLEADGFIIRKEYECVQKIIEQSLDLYKQIGNKRFFAWSLVKLGEVYMKIGSLAEAEKYLEKSLTFAKELGDKILETHNYLINTEILIKKTDYTNGLKILRKAGELTNSCGTKELYAKVLLLTGEIYKKIGKNKEAEEYLTKHGEVVEEITKAFNEQEKESYCKRFFVL